MRVKFQTILGIQEMSLEKALLPDPMYAGGLAERAVAHALNNSNILARLLAHLAESGQITVEEAFQIAGIYVSDLEVIG